MDRTIVSAVNRDDGDPALASDWFDICGLNRLSPSSITFIGLFVDDSGSMTLSTVGASLSLFDTNLAARQVSIVRVYNGDERWIDPFLTTLAPTPQETNSTPTRSASLPSGSTSISLQLSSDSASTASAAPAPLLTAVPTGIGTMVLLLSLFFL